VSEWAIPGYTELNPLGEGGFGAVMLARHDATETLVAIKYLRADHLADPYYTELFRTEAIMLGSLDDPYVTRLYEYVESPAGAAIVMELVDGVTLREILSRFGHTSPEAALAVLYGSLLGLAAAHARGVVHRDYKPTNVLVNAYGASKLTDFGIAVLAGTDVPTGATAAYAPPEQWDAAPASPASDVYAATVTFYECLTGQRPFTGESDQTLAEQHRHGDVPMAPVPDPLRPIVARGLAKDPQYRPADAAALAAELRAVAAGAYGEDWEQRGRLQLGEAALLLAALWPTAAVPAVQGSTIEQVQLHQSHAATQANPGHAAAQASHGHQPTRAELHRWHLGHVRHEEHLEHLRYLKDHGASRASAPRRAARAGRVLRPATAVVAAAAVAVAIATVAATGRSPSSGGTAGHPATVAFRELVAPIPITTTSAFGAVSSDVFVQYDDGSSSDAHITGSVPDAAPGEVARLYAQPFPFKSAPALASTSALSPAGGGSGYSFTVAPAVATHYQVKVFGSAASSTPLAISAVATIYVLPWVQYPGYVNCQSEQTCTKTIQVTIYVPPSALATEMAKRRYLYLGYNLVPIGQTASYPTTMPIDTTGTVSAPQRVAANAYRVTVSYSYYIGDHSSAAYYGLCDRPTEAQDGIGLPGPSQCGAATIPSAAHSVWY
jgi:serine/threonine-protein kinase